MCSAELFSPLLTVRVTTQTLSTHAYNVCLHVSLPQAHCQKQVQKYSSNRTGQFQDHNPFLRQSKCNTYKGYSKYFTNTNLSKSSNSTGVCPQSLLLFLGSPTKKSNTSGYLCLSSPSINFFLRLYAVIPFCKRLRGKHFLSV